MIRDVLAAAVGAVAGFLTGLVPGLHVNTLAAVLQAAPPAPGPLVAAALVAAFGASAFAAAVAATFLGAPSEAAAAHALPGHRLLREGRGYEAAALAAHGAFLGLAGSLALAVPLRFVLGPPVHAFRAVVAATPWLLLALAGLTLASERGRIPYRRVLLVRPFGPVPVRGRVLRMQGREVVVETDRREVRLVDDLGLLDVAPGDGIEATGSPARAPGRFSRALARGLALFVFLLAGALGVLAFQLGTRSPWGLPGSPLLPLLGGLFGIPGLLDMLRGSAGAARQLPLPPRWEWRRYGPATLAGTLCGGLIGLLPGLTSAHAATAALAFRREGHEPEATLVTLGATQGAGLGFTLLAWVALGRARSGALVAAGALAPPPAWPRALPGPEVPLAAAALLLGGGVGLALALAAAQALARAAARVPERAVAAAALLLLSGASYAFTGLVGLGVLLTAAAIGTLPVRWRLRRVHGMGVILVPVLLRLWSAS